jgi:hypothetical protein
MESEKVEPNRRSRQRWTVLAAVAALLLLILGGAAWWKRDDLIGETIDPGTPPPAARSLNVEETAFYAYVAPRLRVVSAEAQELAALGRARSRNLVELQRRGERVGDASRQIDEYVVAHGVPSRFTAAQERYTSGIAAVRRAIEESRSAFVTFDWDRVARAVQVMESGADNLRLATEELEGAAGHPALASPTALDLGESSPAGV